MITDLKIKSYIQNKCIFRAKTDTDNNYVLQFCPYGGKGPTKDSPIIDLILNQNNELISHSIELKRGLYDVYVSVLKQVEPEVDFCDTEKYHKPLMIGEKYKIYLVKEEVECYGEKGIHIKLESKDALMENKDIYYRILGKQIDLKKYYVPSNSYKVDFFVQGVDETNIIFDVENPKFEIIEQ
ncbi:hypothetical protein [Thomasclavelia cocleata]|jgi:hypothetical protein|uniref:hypothetical protein n=1 Tax=Thomasclavelia cocleata TaxID=69824 RepID=UPI00241C800C|nr:hypothetical protein [Thomasclavelia cocleata]